MKIRILLSLAFVIALGFAAFQFTDIATAGPATNPSVAVSSITATSPVLRSTSSIDVSALVTPTYDPSSGPTAVTADCKSNGGNNNWKQ
jgi:hypothetical protein